MKAFTKRSRWVATSVSSVAMLASVNLATLREAGAQEVVRTQQVVTTQPAAPTQPVITTQKETITQTGGPSRPLLMSGIVTFGVAYGAGVIVGATSDRGADRRMLIPLVGPWLALEDREDCGRATGRNCDTETAYKVLIVADGIAQAVGGLLVLGAFLYPEKRTTTRVTAVHRPTLHVSPGGVAPGAYGAVISGTF